MMYGQLKTEYMSIPLDDPFNYLSLGHNVTLSLTLKNYIVLSATLSEYPIML